MLEIKNPQLTEELFAIEQGFWLEGRDYFLDHLDDECLLAFPQQGEMHGVYSRDEIAASASLPNRWRDLKIASRQLIEPAEDVAIISYRGDVIRGDGEPYSALVSSAYVRRPAGWKLAFHQHSPL
jgi:hypothetical protein